MYVYRWTDSGTHYFNSATNPYRPFRHWQAYGDRSNLVGSANDDFGRRLALDEDGDTLAVGTWTAGASTISTEPGKFCAEPPSWAEQRASETTESSIEACMQKCNADTSCQAITFGIMDQQHAGKCILCSHTNTGTASAQPPEWEFAVKQAATPPPFTGTVRVFKYNATHWDDGTGMGVWVDQGALAPPPPPPPGAVYTHALGAFDGTDANVVSLTTAELNGSRLCWKRHGQSPSNSTFRRKACRCRLATFAFYADTGMRGCSQAVDGWTANGVTTI